jgi:TonB family protein
MARSGLDSLTGTVKMCLDKEGGVRSLRILRSTGHSEYDQRLLAGMRTWRYRPYKLDSGAAVSVCTVVTFIYRAQ